MSHQWMRHREHQGVAQLPIAAEEPWRALGWEPCEAPEDVDPALVEHVPADGGPSLAEPSAPEPRPEADPTDNEE